MSWETASQARIAAGIGAILRGQLRLEATFDAQTDLQHDLQLDSIQLLTLIVELENAFEICFAEGDEQGVSRVGELVALVEQRLRDRVEVQGGD